MKSSFTRSVFVGMVLLALGSCSTPSTPPGTTEAAAPYVSGDYKIGPEDVVEVIIWRNADLSKVVTVRPDGNISLPLVGDVRAVGMTAVDLAKDIKVRLKDYKNDPSVSVVVQQVNSYNVYVMGEVVKPGRFQLKSFTTALQAISLAGGFTQFAVKNKIFVLRKLPGSGTETRINVHYGDIISGADTAQNIVLIPGDTVVVPQ